VLWLVVKASLTHTMRRPNDEKIHLLQNVSNGFVKNILFRWFESIAEVSATSRPMPPRPSSNLVRRSAPCILVQEARKVAGMGCGGLGHGI
jgi:hypothetical protein